MRFLLIEDNAELAQSVSDRLKLDGHAVDIAGTLADASACLLGADYDLMLLDIMLPDGDGVSFLAQHRATNNDTPVIATTARSAISDRVSVLDAGADDYITKPFDFAELEARVRAVLRRRGGASSNTIHYHDIVFNPLNATVSFGGVDCVLRNRELRLLEILLSTPERIFSKAHLYDRLFSYAEEPSDNAIEVYVGRLRKKLEGSLVQIETVRGLGYRITHK